MNQPQSRFTIKSIFFFWTSELSDEGLETVMAYFFSYDRNLVSNALLWIEADKMENQKAGTVAFLVMA